MVLRSIEEGKDTKEVEARKVQKLGSSSLFVTLPKKWINKWNIRPGDKVIVEVDNNGMLKLVAEKIKISNGRRGVSIDLDSTKQPISNILLCLYSLGFDEMIIESRRPLSQNEMDELTSTIKQISGLEITEMSTTRVKMECLLDSDKISEDSLLRRMLNIVAKQFEAILQLASGEKSDIVSLVEEFNRIYLIFNRRILGRGASTEAQRTRDQLALVVANLLGELSKMGENIIDYLETKGVPPEFSPLISELVQKVNNALDEIVMSLIFPSVKRINNAYSLISEGRQILSNSSFNSSLDPVVIAFFKTVMDMLEFSLKTSSCILYLEDFPWIQKRISSISQS